MTQISYEVIKGWSKSESTSYTVSAESLGKGNHKAVHEIQEEND